MMLGEPAYFARYGNGIVLYMVPNFTFPVIINGTTRFAPLVNDSDSNPYLDEGEQYIRALAKAYLLEDVIRDQAEADRMWTLATKRRNELFEESGGRAATNSIRPSL